MTPRRPPDTALPLARDERELATQVLDNGALPAGPGATAPKATSTERRALLVELAVELGRALDA